MNLAEWVRIYTEALPEALRPAEDDYRLHAAARAAQANGWAARQMAARVARHNYAGARNPIVLALMRLESLADDTPDTGGQRNTTGIVLSTYSGRRLAAHAFTADPDLSGYCMCGLPPTNSRAHY